MRVPAIHASSAGARVAGTPKQTPGHDVSGRVKLNGAWYDIATCRGMSQAQELLSSKHDPAGRSMVQSRPKNINDIMGRFTQYGSLLGVGP
jgi:hypothetical protein